MHVLYFDETQNVSSFKNIFFKLIKELSLCNKLKFSDPFIFATFDI